MLHELGHCDLDREDEPKDAQSIMSLFYTQNLFLQKIDINEDPALRQSIYQELFSTQGGSVEKYIEGQAYPTGLQSEDARVCPVKTRLYLGEVKSE